MGKKQHDDGSATSVAVGRGRHASDAEVDAVRPAPGAGEIDGEYTETESDQHIDDDSEGSYVDTAEHVEESTEKGSYVDTDSNSEDGPDRGEYTDAQR